MMDSATFIRESERTLSDQFHSDKVSARGAAAIFSDALQTGAELDALKKLLFYGKPTTMIREPNIVDGKFTDTFKGDPKLLHAALGLITEGFEMLEAVLTEHVDVVNLDEESGDVLWYLAILYRYTGRLPEQSMETVIAKLRQRYPDRFNTEHAINRDLVAERRILET